MSKKKFNGTKTTIIFNVILYFIVSVVSTIHSISLFNLFNPFWLAIIIASAFEFGQVVSLLTLTLMKLKSKFKTRLLFFSLTAVQVIGNLFSTVNYYTKNILNRDVVSDIDTLVVYLSRIYQDATGFGITETLVVVINGSLPIIALLFIENIIEHITGKKNKTSLPEDEKEEETTDDVINDLFSTEPDNKNETEKDKKEEETIENNTEIEEETTAQPEDNGETNELPEPEVINEEIKDPEPEIPDEKKDEVVVEEEIIVDNKEEEKKEEKKPEIEEVDDKSEINNESTTDNGSPKTGETEIIREVEEKKSTKKDKVKGKVRMKVVEGKDKYTFKDIDRNNLPTF